MWYSPHSNAAFQSGLIFASRSHHSLRVTIPQLVQKYDFTPQRHSRTSYSNIPLILFSFIHFSTHHLINSKSVYVHPFNRNKVPSPFTSTFVSSSSTSSISSTKQDIYQDERCPKKENSVARSWRCRRWIGSYRKTRRSEQKAKCH